ncbi:uncharacterized protein FFMR_04696 [Fusarium fujikuroi]|nr:uncharacterized protein FFE2_03112 [Fusarium fujikuroi]SCO36483.1 uncharacterized protein FFNC_05262 [Fusarium fujikuroi]SCO37502.1 uncharacterized protein FFMR_04696 [Fusarium fujikuroi]SCV46597.1 uncharacterized protein FFB14_09314 [Fusarium fujikuroi]VTT59920.1 unnamed protein product [Fusarium fujikuroi]
MCPAGQASQPSHDSGNFSTSVSETMVGVLTDSARAPSPDHFRGHGIPVLRTGMLHSDSGSECSAVRQRINLLRSLGIFRKLWPKLAVNPKRVVGDSASSAEND